MRIAMLGNATSAHTSRWASALAARGHEVHVVSIRRAHIDGATVHRVGLGPAAASGMAWTLLSYLRLLLGGRRILRRLRPEVVHAHYSVTYGVIAVLGGARPIVVTVWGSDVARGDRPARGLKRWLNGLVLRRADLVTAASRFLAEVVRDIVTPETAVWQVPFGVDTTVFSPTEPAAERPFTVGYLKHLRPRYDPSTLVEAFAAVAERRPEARLRIAGDGPLSKDLRRRVARLGLVDRVKFLGAVPHHLVPETLGAVDVLVNSSRSESFGVVILEAAAMGVPVVATRVGGVTETVVDGETGILVAPGDTEGMAAALLRLADDPGLRFRMGEAGRAFVAEHYQWEACVDEMEQALEAAHR